MSAAIASTTFAPITALIIVFEMCQNYGAVMPLALVTTTATWVARQLRRDSIYTEALRRRGVDFDVAFEQMAIASLRAEDLVRTDPIVVRADAPLHEVLDRFSQSRQTAIYVVGLDRRLAGAIDLRDAFQVAGEASLRESLVASDLVRDVARVTPRTPLDEVLRRFSQLELAQLPVVATDDPEQLVGTVARRDVVQALDREVLRRRMVLAQYLGARVPSHEAGSRRSGDLTIREVRPPDGWIGRSVQEVDPYARHGVFLLAVRRGSGEGTREVSPVPPDLRLEDADGVVLLGPAEALERLTREFFSRARAETRIRERMRIDGAARAGCLRGTDLLDDVLDRVCGHLRLLIGAFAAHRSRPPVGADTSQRRSYRLEYAGQGGSATTNIVKGL